MLGTRDSPEYADKDGVKQGERLGIYGIIVINLNDINLAYVRLIVFDVPRSFEIVIILRCALKCLSTTSLPVT